MNGVKSGIQPYALCVINVYGLEMVASASLYFTCASLAPFLAIIAVGLPQVDFNALTQAGLLHSTPECHSIGYITKTTPLPGVTRLDTLHGPYWLSSIEPCFGCLVTPGGCTHSRGLHSLPGVRLVTRYTDHTSCRQ